MPRIVRLPSSPAPVRRHAPRMKSCWVGNPLSATPFAIWRPRGGTAECVGVDDGLDFMTR
jgi:hypothetical protein